MSCFLHVWTYRLLEEEQRQGSDERHIAEQRLHHHSQHAVHLWKHKEKHADTLVRARAQAHKGRAKWVSRLDIPQQQSRNTWQVGNSIADSFHTCLVSSRASSVTYYDNYRDYAVGSDLHVSWGHQAAALIPAVEEKTFGKISNCALSNTFKASKAVFLLERR